MKHGPRGSAAPVERVRPIAERVARSYGLEIFDVQLKREQAGWVLRVMIDRPAGDEPEVARTGEPGDSIGIEECAQVSRDLSAVLDVEDVLDQTYTLEVSSPGLDRPLRHAADYRRFTGRLAKLVLSAAVQGQTFYAGHIQGVENDEVVFRAEGGRVVRIPLGAISRARLEVEF